MATFGALASADMNRNAAIDQLTKATTNQYSAIQASLAKIAVAPTAAAAVVCGTTSLCDT